MRPLRAALPALVVLALGVLLAGLVRRLYPDAPPALVFASGGAVMACALLLGPFRRAAFVEALLEHDVFFISGVVVALVWANVAPASLEALVAPSRFFVNEVLMTFFFGMAAKEIAEATLPGGPLASARKAALPLVATVGGMLGPIAIYLAGCWLLGRPELARGWAIPTATDVAFSAMVARFVFGAAHPAIPFLLLLAIADDAAGLVVLALAYPQGERHVVPLLLLVGLGVVACLLLRRAGVRSPWPYVVLGGGACWFGLHEGGLHPALALVPVMHLMPREGRDLGLFEHDPDGGDDSTLEQYSRAAAAPVAIILGLFGLANAGVPLQGVGMATALVVVALVVGKPLGISALVTIGSRLGLSLPDGVRPRDVFVLGVTAGVGFTVALFVSTVAFPAASSGATLDAAKMGALASIVAAPFAIIAGRLLGVTRVKAAAP